ncbi:hypothetical protein RvY_06845 [Ramazzottius varieornatus]|uniref:NTF2-related export protein n=1 Tax=Ramazzottius varieornatus TaxID=947166 RepID=A0A1D1V003_RAMVA|nr:hypothetical protein RvY_06845 [Ramazzottius varieornatus]
MADFRVQFEEIGGAFVQHFYNLFDNANAESRANNLIPLFLNEQCFQTYENSKASGVEAIRACLQKLSFQKIQRSITTVDCQPLSDGVLVGVMGMVKTDEDPVHSYSETFVLRATNNNFFITNHIFRMAIHNVG